jgi:POT family proton-dependent oligopeptide transporter
MAVWFTANAFANKFAGVLSGLYPDGKTTYFAGYAITNLFDFFILFVAMAGAAAFVLFLIARKLKTMMD